MKIKQLTEQIAEYMTTHEIMSIGGFKYLKEHGYEYCELFHRIGNEIESHNVYLIYKIN